MIVRYIRKWNGKSNMNDAPRSRRVVRSGIGIGRMGARLHRPESNASPRHHTTAPFRLPDDSYLSAPELNGKVSHMTSKEYTIEGMSCQHCVMAASKELAKVDGITVVDLAIGKATIGYESDDAPDAAVRAAIEEAGYRVVA
jgi:copper chaperone